MLIASYDSYLSYINYPTPFAERRLALDIRGAGLGLQLLECFKEGIQWIGHGHWRHEQQDHKHPDHPAPGL